nr:competence protein CoiA family protein [Mobilitalea sibirica]
MVLDWKQAAADRQLKCQECQAPVYLAAGPIKEPYFAHYDRMECDYSSGNETEELKKGKRLLYSVLKRSFPEADVFARYRMSNGMYSTLFVKLVGYEGLAFDYRLLNDSLSKFQLRDACYKEMNIKPVYVLGIKQDKGLKQIDWYQNLLQTSMGYLVFLDSHKEKLTLKKSYSYRLGQMRRFINCTRTYSIIELTLNSNYSWNCDFEAECHKAEFLIQKEKEKYQKEKDNLQREKERYLREQKKQERDMEQYHRDMTAKNREKVKGYQDLNPILLEKCKAMIREGNAHLVSKKYYDAIMYELEEKG